MNEADTRHQIIDRLLHEILAWPHESVKCEKPVHAGYIDYILRDRAGRAALLIEAKKDGIYFVLPTKITGAKDQHRLVQLRVLASTRAIDDAIRQAAQYCPAIGCQYACVTNGHEFIIFRSFIPGSDFMDAHAFVIPDLNYFHVNFTEAYNLLGYQAVTSDRSLQKTLIGKKDHRQLYYPKLSIGYYDSPVQKNRYARFLDPIAKKYFGEILPTDKRMMTQCYVFASGTLELQGGIRKRLSDSLPPFFEADGVEDIELVRTGGKFAERIARSLVDRPTGDVLILYGGKGAGKSTFLKRLLYFDPPTELMCHSLPIIVDCLKSPQDKDQLTRFMWEEITTALNLEGLLSQPMDLLLKLFEDRFSIAKKQELDGFVVGSPDYLRERNSLVLKWKEDTLYVAGRLKSHWARQGKRIVIAFDNTDQLPPELQDHCFLSAQSISRELQCIAIISMREERYCRSRTTGVLDAYQNSGFHLAAPNLIGVFTKRINLVINDLQASGRHQIKKVLPNDAPFGDLQRFFIACLRQFNEPDNALSRFLEECSRDNTRLALDFFTQFLCSGYTHAQEMVDNPRWTVIAHQVIKPMMVPQRFNYDEEKSPIPNVYQCRTSSHGSHFTMLRILRKLRQVVGLSPEKAGYWQVDAIVRDFDSKYGMRQDCEAALDTMLRHGLIEANNRLDMFSVLKSGGVGSEKIYADEVRITAFGMYMLEFLSPQFTYLELVSLDCGLADEKLFQSLGNSAVDERTMAISGDILGRVTSRLERVQRFLQYLEQEEVKEKGEFLLAENEDIMTEIIASFTEERPRVLASAQRTVDKLHRIAPPKPSA